MVPRLAQGAEELPVGVEVLWGGVDGRCRGLRLSQGTEELPGGAEVLWGGVDAAAGHRGALGCDFLARGGIPGCDFLPAEVF